MNWVQKKRKAEEHLRNRSEALWHDTRAAIEDSSRSFNDLYSKELNRKTSVVRTNDHRVRVTSAGSPERTVDVDFNREDLTVKASYHARDREPKTYRIAADAEAAFIVDEKDNRIGADDISKMILETILFDSDEEKSVYSTRGLLTL